MGDAVTVVCNLFSILWFASFTLLSARYQVARRLLCPSRLSWPVLDQGWSRVEVERADHRVQQSMPCVSTIPTWSCPFKVQAMFQVQCHQPCVQRTRHETLIAIIVCICICSDRILHCMNKPRAFTLGDHAVYI